MNGPGECYGGGIRHTLSHRCIDDEHHGAEKAWKEYRQRICSHPADRVLGPTRWVSTSMCMACGKELGAGSPNSGEVTK